MKNFLLTALLLTATLLTGMTAQAAVTITELGGWFESGYVKWSPVSNASDYNVYVRPENGNYTKIDAELVRNYGSYLRADMVGLKAGNYQFKIVPVISGAESTADATESDVFTATAHDRTGFAHYGNKEGIGAYNDDGTLKDNAKVIYVYANNAKTVSATIGGATRTGLQDIVYGLQKGTETAPVCIRIIGTIKDTDMDSFGSSAEGLQVKGKNNYSKLNLTIEGIGDDAAIWGFGILVRNASYCEFRNFAIMLCMDDCLSLDTGNSYVWIHNMDFFYGNTGGDSDQAKGDGTVDIKGKSTNITVSYNHFFDSGKSSLGGMKSETTNCVLTYHHNWFDHSDSRHPRIRTMFFHIYNNYFDGCSKYGVGMTMGGSAFVENNYFRNTKYPMMISKQGTDATGDGTFSGETGGVIKAYGNTIKNAKRYVKWSETADGDWDAYEASASESVPSTVTCASGGTSYNDNLTGTYSWTPDAADDVPAKVTGTLGAGRMNKGDFKWQFNNATQDENYGVITALKSELQAYKSALVGFTGSTLPTSVNNGGYDGTSRSGGDSEKNEDYKPSYGGTDSGSDDDADADVETQAYLSDSFTTTMGGFYLFNTANDATTKAKVLDKVVTLAGESTSTSGSTTSSKYNPTPNTSDTEKYGLELVKSTGSATFYCASGISTIAFQLYRTGTYKSSVSYSDDGTTWTTLGSISLKKGVQTASFSTPGTVVDPDAEVLTYRYPKYVKIENAATGSVFVQGVKIWTVKDGEAPITAEDVTEENNANATVTIDGEKATSKTFTADATETTATIVVTPEVDGATVTASTTATAVEGKTNTWTIAVPSAGESTTATFTVTAKDGTTTKSYTVTVKKEAEATPDPTPTPGDESTGKIYSWNDNIGTTTLGGAATTATVKLHSNADATDCIKFGKNTDYVQATPASGGFKAGDVVYIAGAYNNKNEKELQLYVTTSATSNKTDVIYTTQHVVNGQTSADDPTLESFTLTADCDNLYVWRATGSTTYLTTFYVVRSTTNGINNIDTDTQQGGKMYDLQGRRINRTVKGQVYIVNGKKYISK